MSLTGGKRKANKGLKAWVTFVKKVQKEEKLSYKDAIHRAKQRKDKGEKWMKGGENTPEENEDSTSSSSSSPVPQEYSELTIEEDLEGGRRRRRTMRKSRKSKKSRKSRKSRSRSSRRR